MMLIKSSYGFVYTRYVFNFYNCLICLKSNVYLELKLRLQCAVVFHRRAQGFGSDAAKILIGLIKYIKWTIFLFIITIMYIIHFIWLHSTCFYNLTYNLYLIMNHVSCIINSYNIRVEILIIIKIVQKLLHLSDIRGTNVLCK